MAPTGRAPPHLHLLIHDSGARPSAVKGPPGWPLLPLAMELVTCTNKGNSCLSEVIVRSSRLSSKGDVPFSEFICCIATGLWNDRGLGCNGLVHCRVVGPDQDRSGVAGSNRPGSVVNIRGAAFHGALHLRKAERPARFAPFESKAGCLCLCEAGCSFMADLQKGQVELMGKHAFGKRPSREDAPLPRPSCRWK